MNILIIIRIFYKKKYLHVVDYSDVAKIQNPFEFQQVGTACREDTERITETRVDAKHLDKTTTVNSLQNS